MRPAGRVQLVVGYGASVLVWSVCGQILCSHTGGVLRRLKDSEGKWGVEKEPREMGDGGKRDKHVGQGHNERGSRDKTRKQ